MSSAILLNVVVPFQAIGSFAVNLTHRQSTLSLPVGTLQTKYSLGENAPAYQTQLYCSFRMSMAITSMDIL
jgi:hypothetical protein